VIFSRHKIRRIPRLAIAGLVAAGFLCGCSPSSAGQSGVTYARYTFTCCSASDIQGAWHPGETVSLHWIVVAAGATADSRPSPITITAVLAGPYANVNGLKGGAPAARTLPAAVLNRDDRNPTAPISTFALPSDFAPGFYNLAFKVDYGSGNSLAGASVVQVGAAAGEADPMAVLGERPLNLPVLNSTTSCPASPMVNSGSTAPNYGFGAGPVYLSGQSGWYSDGQTAVLMVDSTYAGPLLVRTAQLGGSGTSQITLADLPPADLGNIAAKESQHSVAVVSAVHTPEGWLELQADLGSSSWRAWFGRLSTSGPGCFALQLDGAAFSEVIVVYVHGGPPPPG
jgi:hypothetical protein